ncbi:MAG: hypothetical protein ONB44_14495 [candidate division KSB1 bacterium]|nr:hypothetical protein [candidate division KSB1 bacterium]MDZ7303336.1 hypothetical protein [candidate division KSB1 bacterium]MDZ7310414.1 hypothetical protein [candidate division KSB1 bacterium]
MRDLYFLCAGKILFFLKLHLSEPRQRHLKNFSEVDLACTGTRTIAKLNRLIPNATAQSPFTDFFTCSSWEVQDLRRCCLHPLTRRVLEENQNAPILSVSPLVLTILKAPSPKPVSILV